jgi:molybdate transport system substrate-binding protein
VRYIVTYITLLNPVAYLLETAMYRFHRLQLAASTLLLICLSQNSAADTLNVAVASNFAETLERLVKVFEQQSEHRINLIRGSSGRHYGQIMNGAPFDILLSADSLRPGQLEREGRAIAETRQVYAIGRLVLFSTKPLLNQTIKELLSEPTFKRLAVANSKLAPYGVAARQVIESLGLDAELATKLVTGENIGQTFQFVGSGNAELGLVALSQALDSPVTSYYKVVPEILYQPIAQELVVLKDSPAASSLVALILSEEGRQIIETSGYLTADTVPGI